MTRDSAKAEQRAVKRYQRVMSKSFYVVDCSYHFRASFFALPPIYSPSGALVNAVYGFVGTLFKLLKKYQPEALAVADDAHGRYFRHELLPTYKSEKKPVPDDCNKQMPILMRVLDAMGVSYLQANGFEADDIIATLSVEARRNGYRTNVCSKDKDLQQLLAEDVVMLDIGSGLVTTSATLREKKGILPNQVPDMLALVGDKVDSIPGVPGVGPKTAARLLDSYGTLENLLRHTDELSDRLRTAIMEHSAQALLAKSIATVQLQVPLVVSFGKFEFQAPANSALAPLFRELGLEALLRRLGEELP